MNRRTLGRRALGRMAVAGVAAVLCIAVLGIAASETHALPRYAARYQQNCNLCHTNPTGGGQRTTYASQFLVPTEMVLQPKGFEELGDIDPQLNDFILLGVDLRTIYSGGETRGDLDNFFQMQSALTITVQATERLSMYLNRGTNTVAEVFGLGYVLPTNGYVKVGRFVPAFGWRWSDHTMFTREALGFAPPAHSDVGLEFAFAPGRSFLVFDLINGQQGSLADANNSLAFSTRLEQFFSIKKLHFSIGASYYDNDRQSLGRTDIAGPFGFFNWGKFTWVGEADWSWWTPDGGGEQLRGFVTSNELSWQFVRGLDLMVTYNFLDEDRDTKSGALTRVGVGLDSLINPFVQLRLLLHRFNEERGGGAPDDNWLQVVAMAHFLY